MKKIVLGLLSVGWVLFGCGNNQVTSPSPAGLGEMEMSQAPTAHAKIVSGSGMQSPMGQSLRQQTGQMMTPSTGFTTPTQFTSNGQRIYFTATSASGIPITFTMGMQFDGSGLPGYGLMSDMTMSGGMTGGMMGGRRGGRRGVGMGMQGGGSSGMTCANCHGPEGKGGLSLAMGTVVTPDIRYATLSAPELDPKTQEVERPAFDEQGIRRAITQGLDADGTPLKPFMPHWSMSAKDLDDLVGFLKTL